MTRQVPSTCPYCGVGCGIVISVAGERIVWVDDQPGNLSSEGMLCVKGRFGTTFVNHRDRLATPLIRRGGELQPASWDEALDLVAMRFAEHRGRFGSFASAKATNEDAFIQQKFVRLVMGTNNIDHCTRLCHSPSVEAMLQQFGSGATSNSYSDYEASSCIMLVGCDPGSNHPVIASRMRRAIDTRGTRLIVVNPRRIDMCDRATIFLQSRPGTDVSLFNGMARAILDAGLANTGFIAARTEGYEAWLAAVREVTVEQCAEVCGVAAEDLRMAALLYANPPQLDAREPGSCLVWGMGVTQHTNGTDNAHALLNLALFTGQLGRPGSGVSPLRGQNNVQGCGDAGCIPDSLPGYQRYDEAVPAPFEELWGGGLPRVPGLKATDMVEQIAGGTIRAMYIVGENPLLSEPNLHHATELIRSLDFLVVQDLFLHETAQLADVVLPACSFAEKDGTFTNSERRVQRVRRAIAPVGESRPDWEIVCDIARRMCAHSGLDTRQFSYSGPAEIFAEMARLTPFLRGMSYERLDREGGLQWPCPEPGHPGTSYLYGESFPRGLGKFVPVRQAAAAEELPDTEYPLILNTGRMLYHWHGGTITRRVEALMERAGALPVAIHPDDAAAAGIVENDTVVLFSRRGRVSGAAVLTDSVRAGSVFIPFVRLGESAANFLTNSAYDAQSRIPEYKVCAVRIEKKRERKDAAGAPGIGRERA
ncbi:MAG: formate dehydrogenase subunit alpha [Anaerolinea sp.]|nr:formate dehydrogenase subunit alpha [Anaerolinea sp.]